MNMYAQDLEVCMRAMELAFERMRWDYIEAFRREGMDLKDIPDDLHDANKAMQKVKDSMYNCNKLLRDIEKTNIKLRREKENSIQLDFDLFDKDHERLPKRSGRYPWGSVEKADSSS